MGPDRMIQIHIIFNKICSIICHLTSISQDGYVRFVKAWCQIHLHWTLRGEKNENHYHQKLNFYSSFHDEILGVLLNLQKH